MTDNTDAELFSNVEDEVLLSAWRGWQALSATAETMIEQLSPDDRARFEARLAAMSENIGPVAKELRRRGLIEEETQ